MMDSVLVEAQRLLFRQDYAGAVRCIRQAPVSDDSDVSFERRRLLAWALLSCGETKTAYELFWSCAHHEGARAGILILTVLAGQIETAINNWRRYCDKLIHPPSALPDADWHTAHVVRPALQLLERYPFRARSQQQGAAACYIALLHQSQGNTSASFRALAQVTDFYLPAQLLRDTWMEKLLCLPLPKNTQQLALPTLATHSSSHLSKLSRKSPKDVVSQAIHILLYPDLETLQKQCNAALDSEQFQDALEIIRRILILDPKHTPSLEVRWRLYLKLNESEAAKDDLFYLIDLYEQNQQIVECQKVARQTIDHFPDDERALLKMCFLQSRLNAPTHLASYGRDLLRLCHHQGFYERARSYRRWLLRQNLSLDDRIEFEAG